MPVRVGIVDSCIGPDDPVGHGTAVARLVLAHAPMAQLVSAPVFVNSRHADVANVAEAIVWCLQQRARVINLSFGLRSDHAVLRAACAAAVADGALVVAAFPARGGSVYPASYPDVLAVSGDARCAVHAWSMLDKDRLYGAAPLAADGVTAGGASYAAARMSGQAAHFLALFPAAGVREFRAWLAAGAAFRGREQRRAEAFA